MNYVAKLFINGRSQAVRLPLACRFNMDEVREVYVRKDPETGDVILSSKPATWDDFLATLKDANVPDDFLDKKERKPSAQSRDPFEGWRE